MTFFHYNKIYTVRMILYNMKDGSRYDNTDVDQQVAK